MTFNIGEHLQEVAAAVSAAQPDRPRAAGALERLTRLLVGVGPVATAAAALSGPLTTLGQWLGPLTTLGQWLGPIGANLLRLVSAL